MAELLESVQIALFPGAPVALSVEEVAKTLFAKAPELIESRPAEGGQTARVPHLGGDVQISVNPLRVDLIYRAIPNPSDDGPPIFGTKEIEKVYTWVASVAPRLLKLVPGVTRVGVVVSRSEDFGSQQESVNAFACALPSDVRIPDDVVDIALQFNRRRPSPAFSGQLNVICAWQNLARQDIIFANGRLSNSEKYSIRSVVDVNTPPSESWAVDIFSSPDAPVLVSELVNIAFSKV